MTTYEIYTHEFMRTIHAADIHHAIVKFLVTEGEVEILQIKKIR